MSKENLKGAILNFRNQSKLGDSLITNFRNKQKYIQPPLQSPMEQVGKAENAGKTVSNNTALNNTASNNTVSNNTVSNGTQIEGPFDKVYLGVIITGAIAVFALVVICILNFATILIKKANQKNIAKGLILRDTLEYKLLNYSNEKVETEKQLKKQTFWTKLFSSKKIKSTIKNDPLFIDAQITITTILYMILAIFILVFILNVTMSLITFTNMKRSGQADANFLNLLNVDKKYYIGAAGILGVAILSTLLLQFVFKSSVNKVIFHLKKKAYQLKQKIGKNLYVDKTFINMLYSDNFDAIKDVIGQNINGNVQTASKMIFTYNVYKHYTSNFTLSNPYMQDFKEAFSYQNLKGMSKDTFEPIEFLIYDDGIASITFEDSFMKDITSTIESTNNSDVIDLMNGYIRTKNGGITIQDDVLTKLKEVNDITQSFTIEKLNEAYNAILYFTFFMFIIAILIIMILVAFSQLFEKPKKMMDKVIEGISNLGEAIGHWIKVTILGFV